MERANIQSALVLDDICQIIWEDDHSSDFHLLWLRDNCPCAECLHITTHERIFDIMDIPHDLEAPQNITFSKSDLHLQWPDGHKSNFAAAWLRQHCYSLKERQARQMQPVLWDASIASALPQISYDRVMNSDEGLFDWLDMMLKYGFALIRQTPTIPDEVLKVADRVSFLRESNFGRDFDVISKTNPNNVAYTSLKLHSHTDLPYWQRPPGTQFLHCLISEAEGGESTLVDGFNVARILEETAPDAFELLKNQAIPFRFHDENWDIRWSAPTIGCDAENHLQEIRYHAALTAPLDISADRVLPFYKAYRQFSEIIRDPANILNLKLAPGDIMVFDNSRALHGRTAFNPASGARHLQGCYVDNDAVRSKHRALQNKLQGKN